MPGEVAADAGLKEDNGARSLLGGLVYRSGELGEQWAVLGIGLTTEKAARRPAIRSRWRCCFAAVKGIFGMGRMIAKTLTGLVTRITAKVRAYTYGL
jgi:hypothetical protein